MKSFIFLSLAALSLIFAVGCDKGEAPADGGNGGWKAETYGNSKHLNPSSSPYRYTNPVLYDGAADPSVVLGHDGRWYLYSTARNLRMYSSDDLVLWESEGTVFTDETRPASNYLWAPDMNYVDDHYIFYYTVDTNQASTRYINVMTADNPLGPFTPQGTVIDQSQGVTNSIDQCYWEEEDGSKWLFWGSMAGIYAIRLSDDGLSVMDGAEKVHVAGRSVEGTMICKHDGFYYMISSMGDYSGGASSTYHLVITRSESLLGPYEDKEGGLAVSSNYSEFLNASDKVFGPGHCSEVLEMSDGSTWLVYHGYPYTDPDFGRVGYMSQIFWDNTGWPYFILNQPSETWDRPPLTPCPFTYSPVDYMEFLGADTVNRYLYDTGYVPNENTRVELKFQAYPANSSGIYTTGVARRIFQANSSGSSGFSLYINSAGDKFGFSAYGSNNTAIANHEFATDYEITATTLGELTINGKTFNVSSGSTSGKWNRITLFGGTYDYSLVGRIYYFRIYEGNDLIHDFEPVLRNEDSIVMFHDTVTDTYYLPFDTAGFGYGNILEP